MGIINFFDLTDSFTLPPDEAVEFFDSKGLQPTFSYLDMAAEEHDSAFTVAKMMDQDLLATTRDKLDQALAQGKTMQQFREELVPELQKAGWWGDQPITDPVTGQTVTAPTGSTARLNNIFRTNIMSSYSVGHWQKIEEQKEEAPLLMYDAVDDFRTRLTHAQWDERVFSVDDPFWSAWMPPNGYQCRCGVIQMSESEAGDFGLTPEGSPDLQREPWTNPRTGETRQVPKGIDPQFSHNPGLHRAQSIEQVSGEKFSILTPPEQQAIDLNQSTITSAKEAGKRALINSETGRKLQELQDQATARTKQAKAAQEAAQAEIDKAIDQQTPFLANAIKQVSKTKAGKDMNPAELLEEAKKKAKNNEQSAMVANYKQNKIKGKSVSQSQQDAFDSLDETKRQAITEEIEVKSGNFQAKQQIEEFQSAGGFVAEKKAIKKLENEGALKGKEPKAQLKAIQDEAEKQKQAANQKALANSYKANIAKGKNPTEAQTSAFKVLPEDQQQKLLDEANEQKKQLDAEATLADLQKKAQDKPDGDPLKVAVQAAGETDGPPTKQLSAFNTALEKAEKEADAPAAPVSNGPEALDDVGPDMTQITQVGPSGGTNPGGRYLDPTTGQEWVIKTPSNLEIANNEVLAGKLYKAAGANAAEIERVDFKGSPAVASRVNPDARIDPATLKGGNVQGVEDDFAVDAWLANWDAVGEEFDNMMVAGNQAFRIDPGGSLRFRAQGGMKGQAFGDTVDEIQTLRDPNVNPQAAEVFRNVTDDDIRAGVERIAAVDDDTIRELIQEYGPDDIQTQQALFNRLKARREDLKRRFPPKPKKEISEAAPKRATVTENQVRDIEQAGINGRTLPTDFGDVEDHNIRFTRQLDADGNPITRANFTLTGQGKEKFRAALGGTGPEREKTQTLRESISDFLGGINQQRKVGASLRPKDENRWNQVKIDAKDAIKELEELGTDNAQATIEQINKTLNQLDAARRHILNKLPEELPDIPFTEIGRFQTGGKFELIEKTDDTLFPQIVPGPNGFQMNGKTINMGPSIAENRTFDLGGGARMKFFDDNSNLGMDGQVDIQIPGDDAASASKALEALEEMGIDTTPPSRADRRNLLLDQIAFRRYKGKDEGKLENFGQLETIEEKTDFISQDAGFDIRESPDWQNFDQASAFGNGRQSLFRPDLDTPEFREWAKDKSLFHNPNGLEKATDEPILESLAPVLKGGATLTSLRDRLRRGLPQSSEAMVQDFGDGGAASVFTRITRKDHNSTGYFWKPDRLMRRADRMTFAEDNFGNRRERHGNHLDEPDQLQGLENKTGGDETFFKDGLSLFEDLERIQTANQAERKQVIDLFKSEGYDEWPDGRKLEDVIK